MNICRKLLAVLLALLMVLPALCACEKPESPSGAVSSEQISSSEDASSNAPSEPPYDPADYPVEDLTGDTTVYLEYTGGYNGGLRVKSSGELLLSPYLPGLRELMKTTEVPEEEALYAVITPTVLDEVGSAFYTYEAVKAPFGHSKGDFFDIWLKSADFDCGFCPAGSHLYNLDVDVYCAKDGVFKDYAADQCIGRAQMKYVFCDDGFVNSPYYDPTEVPKERNTDDLVVVTYAAGEGGKIEGITKQGITKGSKGSARVRAIPDEGYTFIGWSDSVMTDYRFGDLPKYEMTYTASFIKAQTAGGVATMLISTEEGVGITDTDNYHKATMMILGAAKDKYNGTATLQIRGRGNSSFNGWTWADDYDGKNSYRLKFDEQIRLLGVGESKNRDWVLNANKFDVSGLRNYFVWQLAAQMGSIDYVPSCTWVNLYLNGDYRGVYMVTEFIETGSDRVNVQGLDNAEDPGFLVELDFRGKAGKKNIDYFMLENFDAKRANQATPFVVKSGNASSANTAKMKDFMQKCNDALLTGEKAQIEALIDLDSFVDMFIIEELSKDCDMGGASMFFCRDSGGKLCFTAPWDFDFGFGTYGPACSIYDLCTGGGEHNNVWMERLLKTDWFREILLARMDELKNSGILENALGKVRVQGSLLTEANDMNDARWHVYGNDYHEYVSWQTSGALQNNEDHVNYLVDWIRNRWEVLRGCVEMYKRYKGGTPPKYYEEYTMDEWYRPRQDHGRRGGDDVDIDWDVFDWENFDWENVDFDNFDWSALEIPVDMSIDTEKTINPPTTEPTEG